MSTDIRIAMMAMTTSSSINVNASLDPPSNRQPLPAWGKTDLRLHRCSLMMKLLPTQDQKTHFTRIACEPALLL